MVCTINNVSGKRKSVIKRALDALGKKNFVFIMHNASFPSCEGENTGFGSINSNGGKKFIEFASGLFNGIQMGPAGKTKSSDASPYTGTIFSNNPLFIDLKELTTDKWHNILPVEMYNSIVAENPNKDINKTSYTYIIKHQHEALLVAYDNFIKLNDDKLNKAFDLYKLENKFWLDNDSLYEALIIENGTDYWPNWKNETDKNLLNPKSNEEKLIYAQRINDIAKKYEKEIDEYKFEQFILNIQNDETREYAASKGIKMIADRQVAFSDRDEWAYQSLFLDGWYLGCPPDYFSKDGQAWGFPVMDPERMYNADGSLVINVPKSVWSPELVLELKYRIKLRALYGKYFDADDQPDINALKKDDKFSLDDNRLSQLADFIDNLSLEDSERFDSFAELFAAKASTAIAKGLQYKENGIDNSVSWALSNLDKCDCTEYSRLLAALCFKKGIPARLVTGFLIKSDYIDKDTSIGHEWCEIYVNSRGWVPFDATLQSSMNRAYLKNLLNDQIFFEYPKDYDNTRIGVDYIARNSDVKVAIENTYRVTKIK